MEVEHSRPGRPRRGSAGAPPAARWTKVYDAILRSPCLTADEVRVYGVVASLVDNRIGHGEATVTEIASLARLGREDSKAALHKLLGLGVLVAEELRPVAAGMLLRWRAPTLTPKLLVGLTVTSSPQP